MTDFVSKYLKYKNKYRELKKQFEIEQTGGAIKTSLILMTKNRFRCFMFGLCSDSIIDLIRLRKPDGGRDELSIEDRWKIRFNILVDWIHEKATRTPEELKQFIVSNFRRGVLGNIRATTPEEKGRMIEIGLQKLKSPTNKERRALEFASRDIVEQDKVVVAHHMNTLRLAVGFFHNTIALPTFHQLVQLAFGSGQYGSSPTLLITNLHGFTRYMGEYTFMSFLQKLNNLKVQSVSNIFQPDAITSHINVNIFLVDHEQIEQIEQAGINLNEGDDEFTIVTNPLNPLKEKVETIKPAISRIFTGSDKESMERSVRLYESLRTNPVLQQKITVLPCSHKTDFRIDSDKCLVCTDKTSFFGSLFGEEHDIAIKDRPDVFDQSVYDRFYADKKTCSVQELYTILK